MVEPLTKMEIVTKTRSRRSQSASVLNTEEIETNFNTSKVTKKNSLEEAGRVYMTRRRAAAKLNNENVEHFTSSGKRKREKDAVQLLTNKKSAVIGTKVKKENKATTSTGKAKALSSKTETVTTKKKSSKTVRCVRSKKRLVDKQDIPTPAKKRKVVSSVQTKPKTELLNMFSESPARIRRRRLGSRNAAYEFTVEPELETGSIIENTEIINHYRDKTSSLQESADTRSAVITKKNMYVDEIAVIARKMYQKITKQLHQSAYQSDGQSLFSHVDLISLCGSTSTNKSTSSPIYWIPLCSSTPEQKTPNVENNDNQEKVITLKG